MNSVFQVNLSVTKKDLSVLFITRLVKYEEINTNFLLCFMTVMDTMLVKSSFVWSFGIIFRDHLLVIISLEIIKMSVQTVLYSSFVCGYMYVNLLPSATDQAVSVKTFFFFLTNW